jgi:hypothetical protein
MKTARLITTILFLSVSYETTKGQAHTIKSKSTAKDSVMIDAEENYKIAKADIPEISKEHPEFKFNDSVLPPHDDDCEVCEDDYFRLYAYFLKQHDSGKQCEIARQKLIKIFRNLNGIYDGLEQGGTYFGHMHRRILGYAEYEVNNGKENGFYKNVYNTDKQKSLYIKSLKQFISDEIRINNGMIGKQKTDYYREEYKLVEKLNKLLTNYFYLENAKKFQYSNYSFIPLR